LGAEDGRGAGDRAEGGAVVVAVGIGFDGGGGVARGDCAPMVEKVHAGCWVDGFGRAGHDAVFFALCLFVLVLAAGRAASVGVGVADDERRGHRVL